jgi:hypothetical protein
MSGCEGIVWADIEEFALCLSVLPTSTITFQPYVSYDVMECKPVH